MRENHGQPEKETAQEDRQAQAEEAAETAAAQEEIISSVCQLRPIPVVFVLRSTGVGRVFFPGTEFFTPRPGVNPKA